MRLVVTPRSDDFLLVDSINPSKLFGAVKLTRTLRQPYRGYGLFHTDTGKGLLSVRSIRTFCVFSRESLTAMSVCNWLPSIEWWQEFLRNESRQGDAMPAFTR